MSNDDTTPAPAILQHPPGADRRSNRPREQNVEEFMQGQIDLANKAIAWYKDKLMLVRDRGDAFLTLEAYQAKYETTFGYPF